MKRFGCVLLAAVALVYGYPARAQERWTAVEMLSRGQKIFVEPHAGKKVKGEFLSGGAEKIVLRTKNGEKAISRSEIRKVGAIKPGREKFGLFGGVAIAGGGAGVLADSLRQKNDLSNGRFPKEKGVGFHVLTFVAPIAAGGVLAIMGNYKTVYEAPPPLSARRGEAQ